jgi:hypothetical protein
VRLVKCDVLAAKHICPREAGRGGAAAAPSAPFRKLGSRKPLPQRPSTMTGQGTAHGRFQRAIHRRRGQAAEMAAGEVGGAVAC